MFRPLVLSALALTLTGSFAAAEPEAPALAAPRIIVLYGGPLEEPVYLTDWWDNLTLLLAQQDGPAAEAAGQEVQAALFWGNDAWDEYARQPSRLPELMDHLAQAGRARLLLTGDSRGAVMGYPTGQLRALEPSGLVILARHGVPLAGVPDSMMAAGLVRRFHLAMGNRDTATMLELLDPDAIITRNGVRSTTAEYAAHEMLGGLQRLYSAPRRRGPLEVTVAGVEATVVTSTSTFDGDVPVSEREEMVLVKKENGWAIQSIDWSTRPESPDLSARAAPEVIILHGGPLATPVTIANWWENLELLGAMDDGAHLTRDAAERLPAMEVALFWGRGWGALAKDSVGAGRLMGRLDEASHGRIHLSNDRYGGFFIHGTPAVDDPDLRFAGEPVRRIAPIGLAILHRRGVPLHGVSDSVLVTGTVQHFHEALFNADSATVLDLLATDAVILEGGLVENRAEYREGHLAADIAYLRTVRTRRGPMHVTVVGDAAWARSTTTSERTVDGELRRSAGAELMVLAKGEHGWRIRAIHWSSGRAD